MSFLIPQSTDMLLLKHPSKYPSIFFETTLTLTFILVNTKSDRVLCRLEQNCAVVFRKLICSTIFMFQCCYECHFIITDQSLILYTLMWTWQPLELDKQHQTHNRWGSIKLTVVLPPQQFVSVDLIVLGQCIS